MIDSIEAPYCQVLGDDLVLRTAGNEEDVERVALFNGSIHGHGVVGMTRNLFLFHPATRGRDLIFVEDVRTGQVVSSLCLIPWCWCYGGDTLSSGEMGIVGTQEEYRRRGLIRAQTAFFKQRLLERGCVLSHIQGIPYYYRQFGYDYALPLEGGIRVVRRDLPDMPAGGFTFRPAAPDDLPALMQMYDDAGMDLGIHTVRDEATWHYLLEHSAGTETECDIVMIDDMEGRAAGYLHLPRYHFGDELTVNEVSRLNVDAALASLHHLVRLAEDRRMPGVRLCLPANCTIHRLARSLGAHDLGTYSWQICVLDFAALLRTIGSTLEQRIAASPFCGLTREVQIGLYRQTIALRFASGKLLEVADLGFAGHATINLPPQALMPLVLGYRSLEQIRAMYPDTNVRPVFNLLLETLFPAMQAFLYTIY